MKIITTSRNGKSQRFMLRGDSEGYVTLWNVPDITIEEVKQIQDKNVPKSKSLHVKFERLSLFHQFISHIYHSIRSLATNRVYQFE